MFVAVPPTSGHLSCTDTFARSRGCPFLTGTTVFLFARNVFNVDFFVFQENSLTYSEEDVMFFKHQLDLYGKMAYVRIGHDLAYTCHVSLYLCQEKVAKIIVVRRKNKNKNAQYVIDRN